MNADIFGCKGHGGYTCDTDIIAVIGLAIAAAASRFGSQAYATHQGGPCGGIIDFVQRSQTGQREGFGADGRQQSIGNVQICLVVARIVALQYQTV